MRTRPILILLLFVGAVGMLGWMYYAVTRPVLERVNHQDMEVLADLDD